jgi:cytochrome c553
MRIALLILLLMTSACPLVAGDSKQLGEELFEKQIRPALLKHCSSCHSDIAQSKGKLKGGLNLDHASAWMTGGDSGPAIVAKKPKESLLYQTLLYDGDTKMPPNGKLDEATIAAFKTWIELGSPDPRVNSTTKKQTGLSIDAGREFWSYRPLSKSTVPVVSKQDWSRNTIDRFVYAGLEKQKLTPAPEASRATLARRLYFDLAGLPPTPEQLDTFVHDQRADAVERLVDELLSSPDFGLRWGRHWLDVSRYGESLTLRGFLLKNAWRYRDYVIDQFQQDRPFDQFIREQIAGDLLPHSDMAVRTRQLTATSFLALGNSNLEEQDKKLLRMDVVDEQLDVITKGFLAQTVTCARCHDHKFDPIPTKDYYALAGILRNAKTMNHANVSSGIEIRLPIDAATEANIKQAELKVATLEKELKQLQGNIALTKKVLATSEVNGVVVDDSAAKKVGNWTASTSTGTYIGAGYVHDGNEGKGDKSLTFTAELPSAGKYEVRLAYSHGDSRSKAVPVTVFSADGESTTHVDMTKLPAIEGRYVSLGSFRFEKSGQSFVIIDTKGTKGHVTADAVVFVPQDMVETKNKAEVGIGVKNKDVSKISTLETELKSLKATLPVRPAVHGVQEEPKLEDARIHIRGSVNNLGAATPRAGLQVLSGLDFEAIPADQSGRLQLANWIASPKNPLTSRVIVNRTWHWLMGHGLVRTVDNFGTTGEKPSHPELLDALALEFTANGWSIKKLVRSIVLSKTYQQASQFEGLAHSEKLDPENRWLSRANRKRLDAESIRDAILHVAGTTQPYSTGPTYPTSLNSDFGYKADVNVRSVYLPAFRNSPPEFLEAFDLADANFVVGTRNTSTVAQQALLMMNSPVVQAQAEAAATKLTKRNLTTEASINRLCLECLSRKPTVGEVKLLKRAIAEGMSWAALYHAHFASAEFRNLE